MKPPPMHPVHHAKGNFDMTKDEFRRIEKAMVKPEFMGMLNDYMLEISDPKNKDEYDEYLKQLQKDGDLPKELKLVKPQAGFCIKTTISSKKDKSQSQKLFINCCHSPIVECPGFEVVERNGKKGQNWRLPYSAGKMRYDQNTKKEVCTTIDIAFHPYTFQICQMNPQFQELVCQTALDGANQQMGERNEIISKDYKVLKHMKCKGGEPALLTVRISGTVGDHIKKMQEAQQAQQQGQQGQQPQQGQSETSKRQNGEGYESSLYRDILNQKKEYTDEQMKEYNEKKRLEEASQVTEDAQESNELNSRPIQAPKYRIVYSYPVQYEDFLDRREEANLRRPIELTLNIELPRSTGIKEISLDIEEKHLVLNVPDKYFLDIALPYSVLPDDGNAKFDGKKKLLKVILPIDKSKLPLDLKRPKTYKEFETTPDEPTESETAATPVAENNSSTEVQNVASGETTTTTAAAAVEEQQHPPKVEEQQQTRVTKQSEPLLEIKDKNLVSLNVLNQQEKEQFIEDVSTTPVIEVLGETSAPAAPPKITEDNEDIDEDDVEENVKNNQVGDVSEKRTLEFVSKEPEKKNEQLTFKIQETFDKYFIVFYIPSYVKDAVTTVVFDGKIFILHEGKRTRSYLRLDVSEPFDASKTTISYVTDYVVFNLQKTEEKYWPQNSATPVQDEDFDSFKLLLGEMGEAKRLFDESNKGEEEITGEKRVTSTQSTSTTVATTNKNENLDGLDGDEDDEDEEPEVKTEKPKLELDSKDDTQLD